MPSPYDRTLTPMSACQVSHLLRREIQAPIAAALIRGFAETLGMGRALEIAAAAVRRGRPRGRAGDGRASGRRLPAGA